MDSTTFPRFTAWSEDYWSLPADSLSPFRPNPITYRRGTIIRVPGDEDIRLRIGDKLGSGGFGVVYQCHDVNDPDLQLAIKFSLGIDAWITEAYFGNLMINQRNVRRTISAFPVHKSNGTYHYCTVMELADGDLYYWMNRHRKPCTERKVLRIANGLLEPLVALHEGSAVHRDVTPANIFVVGENRWVCPQVG